MKMLKKSEWFCLERPIGEPEINWTDREYYIERFVSADGTIIWFGIDVNWKREINGPWSVLATNYDAKPLEKYLPDIVYGEDRNYWKECETPIYEQLYLNLKK